jgi:putative ABC transport system permease protein
VDPDEPVEDVMTLEADLAEQVSPVRFMAMLLGGLGGIALGLAAFGIYGTMAYLVTRRTREMGIRMALGADRAGLRRFVLLRGLRLTAIGVLLGIPAALGLTRLMQGVLFSVRAGDPVVLGAVALGLTGISLLAAWRPAQAATRVDPLVALRSE